jgi:CheY-like chemotaxis protein
MSESVSQIYVVDDDVSVPEAVGSLIRSVGLSVKTFSSAQETLARDDKNWRSPGRFASACCEDDTGADGGSRGGLNQPEIVTSSRFNGNGEALGAFGEIIAQSRS